ncbi:MAG: P-loop NTPase family protein [Terriglobia bacterium]
MSLKSKPKVNLGQDMIQGSPSFLHLPDGSKHPIRPDDSNGSGGSPKSKKAIVEVEFAKLDDGRLVELIEDPDAAGHTSLAVWEKGETRLVNELEYKGQLFVPKKVDPEFLQQIKLPSGTRSDQSTKQIGQLIGWLLKYCVDAPNHYIMVLVAFVLSTWFVDRLRVAPYLWIVGPPQSGKTTLLNALALVCRRPLLVGDISSAALYNICKEFKPTLLIDESNAQVGQTNRSLRQMLRVGTTRGAVARKNAFYTAFGAKVIVSPDLPDDPALMSRCIVLPMEETQSSSLRATSDPKVEAYAKEFQKCLLDLRFQRYKLNPLAMIAGAEKLRPRDRDLLCSLATPLLGDEEEKMWIEYLISFLESSGSTTRETLGLPQSLVLAALFYAAHSIGSSSDRPRNRVFGITVDNLSTIANKQAKLRGETIQLNARKVGDVLRSLGFNSIQRTNQGWTICLTSSVVKRIHEFVKRYQSFPNSDPQFPISTEHCQFCQGAESTQQTRGIANAVALTPNEASDRTTSVGPGNGGG